MPSKERAEKTYAASHRFAPMTARKAKPVVDLIRGKSANQAMEELRYVNRRAAPLLLKVLKSAVANAGQEGGVDVNDLFVLSCCANEGPLKQKRKRFRPGPRGRAMPILKRSSHLEVELAVRADRQPRRRKAGDDKKTAETPAAAPAAKTE